MATATVTKLPGGKRNTGPLPAPNSDFYQVTDCLNDAEREILHKVRAFMETTVAPVINKYWVEASFPFGCFTGTTAQSDFSARACPPFGSWPSQSE
jgi:hypothetical protein